jgi:mono/diheme cytochrome c family protein
MRAAVPIVLAVLAIADAVSAEPVMSPGWRFSEQTGEALYANACQACHMGNGEGATGAGRYPALARNPKLETTPYVLEVVLHGQKAMPRFARLMTNEQVAAVTTYVRMHFGNNYPEPVTAEEVGKAR